MTGTRKVKVKGRMAESLKNNKAPGIVVPLVKELLISKADDPDPYWSATSIHPSEMAKENWCARATWLRLQGELEKPKEPFDFGRENIFGEGNSIHTKWQKWLAETGKLWGDWKCLACDVYVKGSVSPYDDVETGCSSTAHLWQYKEVHMHHGMVYGHSDGALLDSNTLIEFKSVGLGTLRIDAPEFLQRYQHKQDKKTLTDLTNLWRDLSRPLKSHLRQGDVYLWLAKQSGLPFNKIIYVYEFKPNQQVKEFSIKWDAEAERRVKPLIDLAEDIEYALETKQEVPCNISQYGCDQCRVAKPPKRKRNVVR